MRPVTLDITKGNGYRVQDNSCEPNSVHECVDFGEVLSHIIYYHQYLPPTQQIKLGRNPNGLDDSQISDIECIMGMHNQLAEIRETFDNS